MIVDWANLRTINLHKNQFSKKILKDSIELTPLTSLAIEWYQGKCDTSRLLRYWYISRDIFLQVSYHQVTDRGPIGERVGAGLVTKILKARQSQYCPNCEF